jgi:TrmH family RNA methyltransferase
LWTFLVYSLNSHELSKCAFLQDGDMVLITSPSNPRISKLQTLQTARGRKKSGLFLMEGPHLLESLLDGHLMPHEVYYQPDLLQRTASGRALLERLLHTSGLSAQQLVEVSERVIEVVSDTQSSQGVVSVLPLNAFTPDEVGARRPVSKRSALLILDDVADPGNRGLFCARPSLRMLLWCC